MFFALWNMLISKVCSKQKLSRGSVSALEPKLCEPGGEREQGKKNTSRDMTKGEGGEEGRRAAISIQREPKQEMKV